MLAALFTGCATQVSIGFVLIGNTLPLQAGYTSAKYTKTGTAMSQSYL